jgi:uncharacterized membrane protein YgcG
VKNEKVETATAEVERNIEWVVKATVGALYQGVGDSMQRNASFEEHGVDVPTDVSAHSHVLQMIFSLLLVNPGYLLRLYVTFVSDSSRASRRLAQSHHLGGDSPSSSSSGIGGGGGVGSSGGGRLPAERVIQHVRKCSPCRIYIIFFFYYL